MKPLGGVARSRWGGKSRVDPELAQHFKGYFGGKLKRNPDNTSPLRPKKRGGKPSRVVTDHGVKDCG